MAASAHAFSVLDIYVYGFAMQEATLPFEAGDRNLDEIAAGILDDGMVEAYPHLAELIVEHALKPGYAFADEFEIGLDLVLDSLERLRRVA